MITGSGLDTKPTIWAICIAAFSGMAGLYGAIDSGGGKTAIGTSTNYGVIGGWTSGVTGSATYIANRSGAVEFLLAAPIDDTLDIDADGMSDIWELRNGLDRAVNDAAGDLDGDGTSNIFEYLAGSDPQASASLVVPELVPSPPFFNLNMETIPGRSYRFYVSPDLDRWELKQEISGDGNLAEFFFNADSPSNDEIFAPYDPQDGAFFKVEIIVNP